MGGFPNIVMNLFCLIGKLVIAFFCMKKFIFRFYDLIADLVAEFPGHLPGLG